jgi:hypothetical protein
VWANGESIGDLPHGDQGFTIEHLTPGQRYVLRLVVSYSAGYSSVGRPIRIRTELAAQTEASKENSHSRPVIVPLKSTGDQTSTPLPIINREHSGSFSKRGSVARRGGSPAAFPEPSSDTPLASDAVPELKARLRSLQEELGELQKQDLEDEHEFQHTQIELTDKRENVKQQLRKREEESGELRKAVTTLEREHTAAQSKKVRQEKALVDMHSKRDRLAEDADRWEREIPSFEEDAQKYLSQKAQHVEAAETEVLLIKQQGETDKVAMNMIEEQIRQTGIRVKELEEEKSILENVPLEETLAERQKRAIQEDAEWNRRMVNLQQRWNDGWVALSQATDMCSMAQQRLDFLKARYNQMKNAEQVNYIGEAEMARQDSQAGHQSSPVPSSNGISEPRLRHPSLQLRNHSTPSPALAQPDPVPWMYTEEHMMRTGRSPIDEGMSDADLESLTGGALASPSVSGLLPANLLGDDDDPEDIDAILPAPAEPEPEPDPNPVPVSQDPPPPATPYLPGLGTYSPDNPNIPEEAVDISKEMASPLSYGDRSPSLMSSAKNSISNFHQHKLSNGGLDSDRRSIRSVSSSIRAPARTGFGRFVPGISGFASGFPRARASSSGENGFAFGTLGSPNSRSLPRAEEGNADNSHGGLSVFKKRGASSIGLFGSKWSRKTEDELEQIWPRSTSSRPASTYSTDNLLPRPSADVSAPFGWNDLPQTGNTSRVGSIAYQWSAIPQSRRESINHEAAITFQPSMSNLHDLELDSQAIIPDEDTPNTMAPIGTKPSNFLINATANAEAAARLNPAARDFKSLLNFTGGSDKKDKGKKKAEDFDAQEAGLVTPLRNKENRFSLIAESGEPLSDDINVEVSPAKSTETPSSAGKESFMRKMTRKGSSGKFSLPTSLFSRKSTTQPSASGEDILLEEGDNALNSRGDSGASAAPSSFLKEPPREGMGMGRSLESVVSGGGTSVKSGFSIPGFGKRRAKKDKEKKTEEVVAGGAPSISEASMASTDEGEGRESEDELGVLGLGQRMSGISRASPPAW